MLTVDYDRLDVRPGHLVLDLGCGAGRHTFEALRRGATVVAVDREWSDLPTVRDWCDAMRAEGELSATAAVRIVQGDGRRLPLPDGSVDRVIAAEVLEHVPDDHAVLHEIRRVLRPGGRVAVTVPRLWPEAVCWALSRAYHEAEGGHVRIYRERQLARRARRAGLLPLDRHHAHALHSLYWWLKCALGIGRDPWIVRAYHRLLVWDLTSAPALTRRVEAALDPLLGKSLILYFTPMVPVQGGGRRGEATCRTS